MTGVDGVEVRYLQTLWHVDRPPLFRSGTSVPPWHDARSDHGGKPLGIALIAVTIFARTALAAGTGARRVATAVLSSVAQELGLQPAEAEVSVAAAPSVDVAFDPVEADEITPRRRVGERTALRRSRGRRVSRAGAGTGSGTGTPGAVAPPTDPARFVDATARAREPRDPGGSGRVVEPDRPRLGRGDR